MMMGVGDFLKGLTLPGRVLFAKVWGSHSHNTGGAYDTKWTYPLLRLLGDAARIARGAEPPVWKEGPKRGGGHRCPQALAPAGGGRPRLAGRLAPARARAAIEGRGPVGASPRRSRSYGFR